MEGILALACEVAAVAERRYLIHYCSRYYCIIVEAGAEERSAGDVCGLGLSQNRSSLMFVFEASARRRWLGGRRSRSRAFNYYIDIHELSDDLALCSRGANHTYFDC